jgi:hypothetical protein
MPITADANDFIYQWDASHDFNAADRLTQIEASLLLINSADDERNPPETGVIEAAMKEVKNGRLYLIPASTETSGHGTTGNAKFYAEQVLAIVGKDAEAKHVALVDRVEDGGGFESVSTEPGKLSLRAAS